VLIMKNLRKDNLQIAEDVPIYIYIYIYITFIIAIIIISLKNYTLLSHRPSQRAQTRLSKIVATQAPITYAFAKNCCSDVLPK